MVYLLKHALIFLPLPRKELHRQVTGPPINKLCFDMLKRRSESRNQLSLLVPLGKQKLVFYFVLEYFERYDCSTFFAFM